MVWTYVAGASDRDRVRLLITDTDVDNPIFQDAEVDAFLTLEGGDVRYAAAAALETIASREALRLKVVRQLDTSTDGAKLADSLRALAKSLREQADTEPAYEVAEFVFNPATAAERIWKQRQRGVLA